MVDGRKKGARAERSLAKVFHGWWGSSFARTPGSGGFRTKKFRDDWNAAADLVTPDPTFPFSVEAKHREGWLFDQILTAPKCEIWDWWAQCVREAPSGKLPLLVFRRNRLDWMYMLRADDCLVDLDSPMFVRHAPTGELLAIGFLSNLFKTSPDEWKLAYDKRHKEE